MEEHSPPTPATTDERLVVIQLYENRDEEELLTRWDIQFIISINAAMENNFTLLLSKPQRKQLTRIWEKLYDAGVVN
jgi:hypothetical protein